MEESIISLLPLWALIGATVVSGALWRLYFQPRRMHQRKNSLQRLADDLTLLSYREALPKIRRELSRARRAARPVSVAVVFPSMASSGANASARNGAIPVDPLLVCADLCRRTLREIDITALDLRQKRIIIVLPESSRSQAEQAIARLFTIISSTVLMSDPNYGIAEFPVDGLIAEDLIYGAGVFREEPTAASK